MEKIYPITRQEKILAGKDIEPITRLEYFLKQAGSGGGGGGGVQSDWNQTDDTAADFIKNKPFGDEVVEIMPERELSGANEDGMYVAPIDPSLFTGNEIRLIIAFDGVEYICDPVDIGIGYPIFGNQKYCGGEDTGEPFALMVAAGVDAVMFMPDEEPHDISIRGVVAAKLDKKYIDTMTVFYGNMDDTDHYLYTDASFTTKVTASQLQTANREGVVIIHLAANGLDPGISFYPCYIYTWYDNPMCYVIIWQDDGFRLLYTAEYTPTT